MTVTRDSVFWTLSMIGAAAVAIGGHYDKFPLLEPYHGYIEMIAMLYGMFAGKMATSPLPGKNDF